MEIVLWMYGFFLVLCCAVLTRNSITCRIRIHFVCEHFGDYDKLPSYDEMLFSPKYWTMWTEKHWLAWIYRQSGAALLRKA